MTEEEEVALTVVISSWINHYSDWIVDSECSNNMTNDRKKLQDVIKYKGGRAVVTANKSRLLIVHISI